MSEEFNKNSTDAMFATILTRLEQHEKSASERHAEFQSKFSTHDTRLSSLESSRNWSLGFAAGTGGFTGWITHLFSK